MAIDGVSSPGVNHAHSNPVDSTKPKGKVSEPPPESGGSSTSVGSLDELQKNFPEFYEVAFNEKKFANV